MKILHTKIGGFTLVEMMVTIGVIGILSTIIYANFGSARAGARDDIRKADLKSLQLAIELYKAQNGFYPLRGCIDSGDSTGLWSNANPDSSVFVEQCPEYIVGLVPDYIAKLPTDPSGVGVSDKGYIYRTNSNTNPTEYKLLAWQSVESKIINSYSDEFARCPYGTGNTICPDPFSAITAPARATYAVYSRNAASW
jgi:prepilin-type N-terminal cleavage/methylation domain-containing protein